MDRYEWIACLFTAVAGGLAVYEIVTILEQEHSPILAVAVHTAPEPKSHEAICDSRWWPPATDALMEHHECN